MTRPIVFLSDYGRSDSFVGICHGIMTRIAADVRIVDLTHSVPRQDVLRGAVELARAIAYMPADGVYVAVVDPGVGSDRRAVAAAAGSSLLVGPDNGLLSLAWEVLGRVDAAVEIESEAVVLAPVSRTFHGRDIFAPAAAHLAAGMLLEDLGPAVDVATLEDLEARVAALEASQADYRAVLAAVNALGANQRDHSLQLTSVNTRLTSVDTRLTGVETQLADFRQESHGRFRSVDEQLTGIKDMIVGRRNGTT